MRRGCRYPTVTRMPVRQPIRRQTVTPVKNLGWVLRHASEANAVRVFPRNHFRRGLQRDIPKGGGVLVVVGALPDGSLWIFRSAFESLAVMQAWVRRPSLAHCQHHDTTETEVAAA